MLRRLLIFDVVLVERLELEFQAGLSVFTGETGAGKSIILDSLGLATGARGDAGLIRTGASQACVIAEFELPSGHRLHDALSEKGIEIEAGDSLLLKRVVAKDGRSKAYVNDQAVSVSVLKMIGEGLLEVHGQHETVGLLDSRAHMGLLDTYGYCAGALEAVGRAHRTYRQARTALETLLQQSEADRAELEDISQRLQELERLNPQIDEEAQLAAERALLGASEQALVDINEAREAVGGDQLSQRLMKAFRALDHARSRAKSAGAGGEHEVLKRLSAAAEALDRTLIAADEALALMDQAADSLDVEPGQLDRVEERLFALRAQARKMNILVEDLPKARAQLVARLSNIEDLEANTRKLRAEMQACQKSFEAEVLALRSKRQAAGAALAEAVMTELAPLKLDKARFRVALSALEAHAFTAHGGDRVEFEVQTNPGADWGGMGAIASGGELARFALALKAALASRGGDETLGPVMIFDEVDQGVGGAVADAVGLRLKRLAHRGQVIVVTHSPQVAARGDCHYKVIKADSGEGVRTRVDPLMPEQVLEELARMLSGAEITPEARAAAQRLKQTEAA